MTDQTIAPLNPEHDALARKIYERDLRLRRKVSLLPLSDPTIVALAEAIDRGIEVYLTEYPEVTL